MKILAQKGLLEMRPGRGTIVIDGTSQALRDSLGLMLRVARHDTCGDLVEVREILEPEIAALAAVRATEKDIDDLRRAVTIMEAHLHDADAFITADNFFHQVLARATQNDLILTLMDPIMELLSEQRKQIFFVEGGPLRGQIYHKQLLDAVSRHDAEAASVAMRAHLHQVSVDASAAQELSADEMR
jgi:GntR family transcriptional regulator, transcriptional repressor for pyruvate dehydrogenase complex